MTAATSAFHALRSGRRSRQPALPGALCCAGVSLLLLAQLAAFGANSGFLAAAAALAELALFALVRLLLVGESFAALWSKAAPLLALFAAAFAWAAAAPGLARAAGGAGWLTPDSAGLELLKLSGLAGLALVGAMLGQAPARLHRLAAGLVAAGAAFVFLSLWLEQAAPLTIWGQSKTAHAFRFTGPLLNANAAGCVFGMIALVSLGQLQHVARRFDLRKSSLWDYAQVALAASGLLAAFGACVLTQSRASLALTAVLGGGLIVRGAVRSPRRSRVSLAVMLLLLLAAGALAATQIAGRWDEVAADAGVRGQAGLHYLRLLGSSPWFGFGLGSFRLLNAAFMTPQLAPQMWDYGAAHGALLQAALEGGWPFAALLAILVLVALADVARAQGRRSSIAAAFVAAALLALGCSFIDIAMNVPAVAAFCALLLGAAWGDAVGRTQLRGAAGVGGDG